MRCYHTDGFPLELPPGHRFPHDKYRLLRERLESSAIVSRLSLEVPEPATRLELEMVHDPAYLDRFERGELTGPEQRRLGFPWSPGLVERSRRSVGATIAAGAAALDDGIACSLAGGTHHAFADRGEGYCAFNDCAVAARVHQDRCAVERVLIFDTDVHQGNGTASVFENDPSVFTASVHCSANFPFRKEISDLDVSLPPGTGDDDYLTAVETALAESLDRSQPRLAFFLSGADPYSGDQLGQLSVTRAGLKERDRRVLAGLRAAGASVAVVMGGGYGRPEEIAAIHGATVATALDVLGQEPVPAIKA